MNGTNRIATACKRSCMCLAKPLSELSIDVDAIIQFSDIEV